MDAKLKLLSEQILEESKNVKEAVDSGNKPMLDNLIISSIKMIHLQGGVEEIEELSNKLKLLLNS